MNYTRWFILVLVFVWIIAFIRSVIYLDAGLFLGCVGLSYVVYRLPQPRYDDVKIKPAKNRKGGNANTDAERSQ